MFIFQDEKVHFKKLELIGFKSFAEKTVIEFEPGVTAVVGPNGCGKSNISDAIRWVLGEQSAKSLRGSSMEDVIFNGSVVRDPVNFAEVSLTLSNEARLFPVDYEEVTISRRLYRSGESEYLLNKNVVRLRDIAELLMGTGIGTESYSVIEQGQMDVVLAAKPEERRAVFEEAAGITKYKSKKKEALRKLEETEANLLRVNDIVQEVKRQIGSIERQAKKAASYKAEFEKLKDLELAAARQEFVIFEGRGRSEDEAIAALRAEEAQALKAYTEAEERARQARAELSAMENDLKLLENQERTLSSELRQINDRTLLNRERIGELAERRENLLRQIENLKAREGESARECGRLSMELSSAEKEEAAGHAFLDSVEADFAALDTFFKSAEAEERSVKQELSDWAGERARLDAEHARAEVERDALSNEESQLEGRREQFLKEKNELDALLQNASLAAGAAESEGVRHWIEAKLAGFKEKVREITRRWFERGFSEGEEEAARAIEGAARAFADEVSQAEGEVSRKRFEYQEAKSRLRTIEEGLAAAARRLEEIAAQRAALLERLSSLGEKRQNCHEREAFLQERLRAVETGAKGKFEEKEALIARLAETRSKQGYFLARRDKIFQDKARAERQAADEKAEAENHLKECEESLRKKAALEEECVEMEKRQGVLSQERDALLRRTEELSGCREATLAGFEAAQGAHETQARALQEIRDAIHRRELEQTKIHYEIDRLKERIFNAYQVDLVVQEDIRQTVAEAAATAEGATSPSLEEAKSRIEELKEKLRRMGPVNLAASEEYDELRERHDFLTKQSEDLLKAKDDLHKAIAKINRTTRELFAETFAQVQKSFTEYFRLLFGGGTAELVLLDEENVLESGIEITARPPGKKLQNISLLSGGEKALTAIALLFSLFKVKPSPFCVLDEIDAPLDESNVDRFLNVLKEFIAGSQFILITHNKRTMSLADILYGITMGDSGISRVVSVRLSDSKNSPKSPEGDRKEVLV